jgi:hypothetical protein
MTFYGSYGMCLRWLGADRDSHMPISLGHNFLAGSFGGFVQSFPSSLLELLKIRLQTSSNRLYTRNSAGVETSTSFFDTKIIETKPISIKSYDI